VRPFRSGELTVVEVALNVVDDEPGSKEQEDEKRGEKKMKMSFPNDSHDKSLKGGRKKKEKKKERLEEVCIPEQTMGDGRTQSRDPQSGVEPEDPGRKRLRMEWISPLREVSKRQDRTAVRLTGEGAFLHVRLEPNKESIGSAWKEVANRPEADGEMGRGGENVDGP
jgi:hypothetical protein